MYHKVPSFAVHVNGAYARVFIHNEDYICVRPGLDIESDRTLADTLVQLLGSLAEGTVVHFKDCAYPIAQA